MTVPIELEHRQGAPCVRLVGDVDMRSVVIRAGEIYAHTCEGDVIVDLADVSSVDGPGLTVLLMTLRAADSVQLINVPPVVRSLLDVSSSAATLRVDAA